LSNHNCLFRRLVASAQLSAKALRVEEVVASAEAAQVNRATHPPPPPPRAHKPFHSILFFFALFLSFFFLLSISRYLWCSFVSFFLFFFFQTLFRLSLLFSQAILARLASAREEVQVQVGGLSADLGVSLDLDGDDDEPSASSSSSSPTSAAAVAKAVAAAKSAVAEATAAKHAFLRTKQEGEEVARSEAKAAQEVR
jgi:hypothetical protein